MHIQNNKQIYDLIAAHEDSIRILDARIAKGYAEAEDHQRALRTRKNLARQIMNLKVMLCLMEEAA